MIEGGVTISPDARSAGAARRFVHSVLTGADLDDETIDSAVLLASELTTNGILHARSDLVITVKVFADRVRVEVADENPRLPFPAVISPDALSGRGLQLVQLASHSWGIESHDAGKVVWFELGTGSRRTDV